MTSVSTSGVQKVANFMEATEPEDADEAWKKAQQVVGGVGVAEDAESPGTRKLTGIAVKKKDEDALTLLDPCR